MQNTEDAEEVAQDVFLTIFKKADTFKGNSKVGTWIYRITVNKSLNKLRTTSVTKVEINETHKIDFTHPGIQLENKEKGQHLFKAIEGLSENQKTAFILTYVEGLPQQKVAEIMEGSVKSIESLLQRAKANLRTKLNSMYPEGKE